MADTEQPASKRQKIIDDDSDILEAALTTNDKQPSEPSPANAEVPLTVSADGIDSLIKGAQRDLEDGILNAKTYQRTVQSVPQVCPFLDTIDRKFLDFDFEKVCSVSLRRNNVYMCLICGKYYQGRGEKTHAFTHSLLADHHVFLCLTTNRFYCLPDNYEVIDPSLDDILYVRAPTFKKEDLKFFNEENPYAKVYDTDPYTIRASQDGTTYIPGIVGLNDIKDTDYASVVFHALCQVKPIRDFFLLNSENSSKVRKLSVEKLTTGQRVRLEPVRQMYGELVRKMMNRQAFRSHISPHEIMQAVRLGSDTKFQIIKKSDALEFFQWLVNALHFSLSGHSNKSKSSVVYKTLRGEMHTWVRYVPLEQLKNERSVLASEPPSDRYHPFLHLTLDVPELQLFADKKSDSTHIIPRVDIMQLLQKYNGINETQVKRYGRDIQVSRYKISKAPSYLTIAINRFHKSLWDTHKNPTIVMFPLDGLDLSDMLEDQNMQVKYSIVANICHDDHKRDETDESRWRERAKTGTNAKKTMDTAGKPTEGAYKVQVLHEQSQCWFEIDHLHVREVLREQVQQTESYIQIWKRTYYGPVGGDRKSSTDK